MRVLFVDADNANRSQMAEACARLLASDALIARNAGTSPAELSDDRAIRLKAAVGCHPSRQQTMSLASLGDTRFDAVIYLGERRLDTPLASAASGQWRIPDPTALDVVRYRDIRHDIAHRVRLPINVVQTLAPAGNGTPEDLGSD